MFDLDNDMLTEHHNPLFVGQHIAANRCYSLLDKKAQLSLTNPRDAKACQKLFQFDVLTTLSLTILYSFV